MRVVANLPFGYVDFLWFCSKVVTEIEIHYYKNTQPNTGPDGISARQMAISCQPFSQPQRLSVPHFTTKFHPTSRPQLTNPFTLGLEGGGLDGEFLGNTWGSTPAKRIRKANHPTKLLKKAPTSVLKYSSQLHPKLLPQTYRFVQKEKIPQKHNHGNFRKSDVQHTPNFSKQWSKPLILVVLIGDPDFMAYDNPM